MQFITRLNFIIIFCFAIVLSACGGGGGNNATGNLASSASSSNNATGSVASSAASSIIQTSQTFAFAVVGEIKLVLGSQPYTNIAIGEGTGTITYTSSDTSIAKVNDAGEITINAAGHTVITANKAADSRYLSATASYNLNITNGIEMTAWIGRYDTLLNFSSPINGSELYRSNDKNCDFTHYISCLNGQVSTLNGSTLTDTVSTLSNAGYYLIKNNNKQTAVTLDKDALFSGRYLFSVVVFKNKLWLIGGKQGNYTSLNDIWSSSDGVIWTQETKSANFSPRSESQVFQFNNQLWLIGGIGPRDNNQLGNEYFNDIWSSADGINWVKSVAKAPFRVPGEQYANEKNENFVFYNNQIWLFKTGWTGNSTTSELWVSPDGLKWTQKTIAPTFADYKPVVFANRLWLFGNAVPKNGEGRGASEAWSSLDGINWEKRDTNLNQWGVGIRKKKIVSFDNKLWAFDNSMDAGDNTMETSSDGVNWVSSGGIGIIHPTVVVFDDQLWIFGDFGNIDTSQQVFSSRDGINWTQKTSKPIFQSRFDYRMIGFKNKLILIGNNIFPSYTTNTGDNIWSSNNGIDWTLQNNHAPNLSNNNQGLLEFNDKLWVLNSLNEVWSSSNGVEWSTPSKQTTNNPLIGYIEEGELFSFNDKLWLTRPTLYSGGPTLLWSSIDGITWTLEARPLFIEVDPSKSVHFNGKLVLITNGPGSINCTDKMGNVWISSDAFNWTKHDINIEITNSEFYSLTAFDGKLWLIGGNNNCSTDKKIKIWSSTDGIHWVLVSNALPFKHVVNKAIALNNRLLVFDYDNDVWSSTDGIVWRLGHHQTLPLPR